MLSAHEFSFAIGAQRLLDRISFQLAAGRRLAVVGPNGAGKSTLLKCFCRILNGTSGWLGLSGSNISALPQGCLAKKLAYVPQAAQREDPHTVQEFVLLGRYPYWSPFSPLQTEDTQAVERALAQTHMQAFAGRRMDTLSGGERQKAMIAAALAQGADVLLLDEPTAFLDPLQQEQVAGLLKSLHAGQGTTWVEVTHDINRAARHFDFILGLRQGKKVFWGPPAEFMTPTVLAAIYGKQFVFTTHPVSGERIVIG